MRYETIDWDTEARRVVHAFGLQWLDGEEFPCHFVEKVKEPSPFHPEVPSPCYRQLTWENDRSFMVLPRWAREPIAHFSCEYNEKKGITFAIDIPSYTSGKASYKTDITIHWHGYVKSRMRIRDNALFLAKGLHNLGMLMPEVEAALEISVTAKDKANWTNEFKGIIICETMDWAAEAKRIARAFRLPQEIAFKHRFMDHRRVADLEFYGEDPLFQKNYRLRVCYSSQGRHFSVKPANPDTSNSGYYWHTRPLCEIGIGWDGTLLHPSGNSGDYLAEGLVNLGLLTPEVEAGLNANITAHQKVRWVRAFKKRKNR